MTRIVLPIAGLLAVLVACADTETQAPTVVSNPVYTEPVVDPWQSEDVGTDVSPVASVDESEGPQEVVEDVSPEVAEGPAALPPGRWFSLRRGETLAHFARWSDLPVEDIATWSGLELTGSYHVGTEVFLPITGEQLSQVESARAQHREARVDGYLAMRGGSVGNDFYAVRTGDTAWDIARHSQDIPVWLLEAYNPSVDLDRLRPGDELMVPVLADTVADAVPDVLPEDEVEQPLAMPVDAAEEGAGTE